MIALSSSRDDAILAARASGLSASKIAAEVAGQGHVVTTNMVKATLNRLKGKGVAVPPPAKWAKPPRQPCAPAAPREPARTVPCEPEPDPPKRPAGPPTRRSAYDAGAFVPAPGQDLVAFADLRDRQCRWPFERDGETLFCGAPVAAQDRQAFYCACHDRRANGGRSRAFAADECAP